MSTLPEEIEREIRRDHHNNVWTVIIAALVIAIVLLAWHRS
jgi:uncharacterized integral membrane protein